MAWHGEPRRRQDVVTIPTVWLAVVLSLLVHVAALLLVAPRLRFLADARDATQTSSLAVQLVPPTSLAANVPRAAPTPPAAAPEQPAPPSHERPIRPRRVPPKPQPRIPPRPPLAVEKPAASLPEPAHAPETMSVPERAVRPPPMPPAPAQDLAAYVEARRRARGEATESSSADAAAAAAKGDLERRDQIVAANLGLGRTPTFNHDKTDAGGIFQIRELGFDDARFYFFGFDKDINRDAKQLIEVRRGNNSDIRIAVVRKMIAIIRENISGDFLWISQQQGRRVTLSARPQDNAGLEDFIMRDIFPDPRVP
jgi:outer membrane biosynthesis protein TonB